MPDPNLVRINTTPYSWTSCAFFCAGIPYKGFTAVNHKDSRESEIVWAGQQDGTPLGQTSGVYKVDSFTFTMLRDSANALMTDLTLLGLGSFGDARWVFMQQLFEPVILPSLPSPPQSTIISDCKIVGVEEKQEQGSGKLVTDFTCSALYITRTYSGVPLQLWSKIRTLLP